MQSADGGKLVAEGLLITNVSGEWEVWCGADGENIINAHLIGHGDTKAAAVAEAITETVTLLRRLRTQAEVAKAGSHS